jgi:hypothetical protein
LTWERIGMNLPKEPVNVIKEDPKNENILYVGTDHGVYVSLDRGKTFMAFNNGLPAVPVHDLLIHPRENDLVLGTHGRSIYIANVSHVQEIQSMISTEKLKIFPLPEMTSSERWGAKGWTWAENFNEPEMRVIVYSNSKEKGQMKVTNKDQEVLFTKEVDLDKGLNYLFYNMETNATSSEKKDNGKRYLSAGDYTLEISSNGQSNTQSFNIKEPRNRSERKE